MILPHLKTKDDESCDKDNNPQPDKMGADHDTKRQFNTLG